MAIATSSARNDAALDDLFSALSNPTRRSIVRRLVAGDATVSDLAAPFDMTLPAVSKHLAVLERAGVIRRERHGRSKWCTLQPEALGGAEAWLASCRQFWTESLDSLADYVESESEPGRGAHS